MEFTYERKVNYYETDKMSVVHHSNYIRYMEECRCAWLEAIGLPFCTLEENGITIPVLGISCTYKQHVSFGDVIIIYPFVKEYTGIRLTVGYEIKNKKTNKLILEGETKHCFTNNELKPINLKKRSAEFSKKFEALLV